jgi:hypothetical protein
MIGLSTEASINLADDDELLRLMQAAGFATVFVGIESPDEETLRLMQKKQNAGRNLVESIRKIYAHGMFITTGYIIGFDNERGSVAQGILDLIEDSATPANMVGLLFALPGTQLSRRLAREGRLHAGFDRVNETLQSGGQCSNGINFESQRPRVDILRDFRRVLAESYEPSSYFGRIERVAGMLNCSQKRLNQRLGDHARDLLGLARLTWRQGVVARYRLDFWRTLWRTFRHNPGAIRYAVALMAFYLHFDEFVPFVISKLDASIEREETERLAAMEADRNMEHATIEHLGVTA